MSLKRHYWISRIFVKNIFLSLEIFKKPILYVVHPVNVYHVSIFYGILYSFRNNLNKIISQLDKTVIFQNAMYLVLYYTCYNTAYL